MANNHILTKKIGNLRGFSTYSIFLRPSNVADVALNVQKAPDGTIQLRRGFQCQTLGISSSSIQGMGLCTFDNPNKDIIQTVSLGADGYLYNKLTKQIYFYYFGQIAKPISTITSALLNAQVTSFGHGLADGATVVLRNIVGDIIWNNQVNNKTFTITYVDVDNFLLNYDTSMFPPYPGGGYWSVLFADQRYLTMSIFVDPALISTVPSITCNITINRSAQVDGTQTNVNTITINAGNATPWLVAGNVVQFYNSLGTLLTRNILASTVTTITIDGAPVSVVDGSFIDQFFTFPFGNGYNVTTPYLISQFITAVTDPLTGVAGLQVAVNGDTDKPAAFLQIFEPTIINTNNVDLTTYTNINYNAFTIDYWYWDKINYTLAPPFPAMAVTEYQNSEEFENAAFAVFNDVIYITDGADYPQKYDAQTVYRTGMPIGLLPLAADNTTTTIKPFTTGNKYQYAITYQQIDNQGNSIEGEISPIRSYSVIAAAAAIDVTVNNLTASIDANWNTNTAIAKGGAATVYGPDVNGFYYDLVQVDNGYTLKIGDSAYYFDSTIAQVDGLQTGVLVITVKTGHGVQVGDLVYFEVTPAAIAVREVEAITATTITIAGPVVTVADKVYIGVYRVSPVFADVAIVNGIQTQVNKITVDVGHTILANDVVEFVDAQNRLQRRTVTLVDATHVTIDGIPVNIDDAILISATNPNVTSVPQTINLQRPYPVVATLGVKAPISNNLRINIYRTEQGKTFGVDGELYLVASIPNDGSGTATQVYTDSIADAELSLEFSDPELAPNPPPISKYVRSFGNQIFYAGGERNQGLNSDNVFFSEPNSPEYVSLASNFFSVPNVDDDVTGIGVSGSTLVVTKNHSLWATTGNFITGQIDVVQIAPGSNIGCVAHATIAGTGSLMYFTHTNGVYAISENQLFPTDAFGNPIPLSLDVDSIFRETNYLPQYQYKLKRAVAINYMKDNQYLLFLPCEDAQTPIRTANYNSIMLCYDYQGKNWYKWTNMNAAGGMAVIEDDLYFQERRYSGVSSISTNLYKQHRFYRLIDHADHASEQDCEWRSSWEDLGQPEIRKKFCRCILLMDRLSQLYQNNNPIMEFSSYVDRIPNLQSTIATITQVQNLRNSTWSLSPWSWTPWSGYQDSFITVNLKSGTVTKSIQVGFKIKGINMDIRLAGFQLEAIPENRITVVR